jgi:hypothetical protein
VTGEAPFRGRRRVGAVDGHRVDLESVSDGIEVHYVN